MGFITNQWLKGSAERNRGHYPVKAGLKLHPTTSNWCKRNGVAAQIGATRTDGDYQTISLTTAELSEFFADLGNRCRRRSSKKSCSSHTLTFA